MFLGNPAFVLSFLLGFRLIVISSFFLEPLSFLLFVYLLISCFLKKERFEKKEKAEPFCYPFSVLAWFEEVSAFRCLGNVHPGSLPLPLLSKGSLFLDQPSFFFFRLFSLAFFSSFFFSFCPLFLFLYLFFVEKCFCLKKPLFLLLFCFFFFLNFFLSFKNRSFNLFGTSTPDCFFFADLKTFFFLTPLYPFCRASI